MTTSESTASASEWEVVEGDGYVGVITHDGLDAWPPPTSQQTPWDIGPDEVRPLEEALADRLRADGYDSMVPRLGDYTRWYVGYLQAPDDRHTIPAQFSCRRDEDWLERVPLVLDGGDCYFTVTYDLDRADIVSLVVNGEA